MLCYCIYDSKNEFTVWITWTRMYMPWAKTQGAHSCSSCNARSPTKSIAVHYTAHYTIHYTKSYTKNISPGSPSI